MGIEWNEEWRGGVRLDRQGESAGAWTIGVLPGEEKIKELSHFRA